MRNNPIIAGTLLALSMALSSAAQDQSSPSDRLQKITAATTLTTLVPPWHLKLQVSLPGADGSSQVDGTFERWQAGADYRMVSTFGSSTTTRLEHNGESYLEVQGSAIPEAASALLEAVLHPGPGTQDLSGVTPEVRRQILGNVTLDCIMLTRPIAGVPYPPLGLFPTYCLAAGDHLVITYDAGSDTVVRTGIGKFLEREVTTAATIREGKLVEGTGKVVVLSTFSPKPDEFAPTPELIKVPRSVQVSGGVMQGKIISAPAPVYPADARAAHLSGTVVLTARIGRDGHVYAVRPLGGPGPSLMLSAMGAVRKWVYKPYLLNGNPIDVNTTVTVNFSLDSRF